MPFQCSAGENFDVVVLGAGISGIDAAYHLKKLQPGKSFVVLERRSSLGGTWDLFRYPGIRSDSSMITFGYRHKPWTSPKQLAQGKDILAYLQTAVDEAGLSKHIRFGHHAVRAGWSTSQACWELECENGARFTCRFLFTCMGYYDYDRMHKPHLEGIELFTANGGQIVHPQTWPRHLDYTGKRVVIVGSGATAITLVPSMAKDAAHVVMLQRSPTYIMPLPNNESAVAKAFKDGHEVMKTYQEAREMAAAQTIQNQEWLKSRSPEENKRTFIELMRGCISREDMSDEEFNKHFTPRYAPWEQRVCMCPNGDFYEALRSKKASVCTDEIAALDVKGVLLKSGGRLDADIVVTATGLRLHENAPMASMEVTIDGIPYVAKDHCVYKGCMLSGVPNLFFAMGYFNSSWTLKADITCTYVCRVLEEMKSKRYDVCCPRLPVDGIGETSAKGPLSSGYILRAIDTQPKIGTKAPWALMNSFFEDRELLEQAPIDDGHLEFRHTVPVSNLNFEIKHMIRSLL